MKPEHRRMVRHYFSDWAKWLALVTCAFAVTMACLILFTDSAWLIWLVGGLFVVLYLSSARWFVRFLKVVRDIRRHAVRKADVVVSELAADRRYSFASPGGEDKTKYILTDTSGSRYLLCAAESGVGSIYFSTDPAFMVEIEYLESSGLVLSMKLPADKPTSSRALKQGENKQRFREYFEVYFR